MKKAIFILAVLVVALIGLTSYNSNTTERKGDDRLLASVKQERPGTVIVGSGKKEKGD